MSWDNERPEPLDDDELVTREEAAARRSRQARVQQEIRARRLALQASAPDEARHSGTDQGQHHRPGYVPAPWIDDSTDPLDIVGRQSVDQIGAYEMQEAERARWEAEEARSWLEAHRPRNVGPW